MERGGQRAHSGDGQRRKWLGRKGGERKGGGKDCAQLEVIASFSSREFVGKSLPPLLPPL